MNPEHNFATTAKNVNSDNFDHLQKTINFRNSPKITFEIGKPSKSC